MAIRQSRFWLYTVALLFFIGLALILLHPLIVHTGAYAGGFDYFNYNWNFWWMRHALTTPGLSLYASDYVFHPLMNNFGYHALAAVWFPLWSVVEPFIGTLAAVTLIIVVGCVLNGFVTFIWLRSEGIAPGLALIGGATLQALPISRYFYYNTHLNLMDWFWLPAHLLFWRQIVRAAEMKRIGRGLWWAGVTGLGIWGLGLTDLQFPIFAAFVIVPYGLWTLWRSPVRARLIAFGMLAVIVGGGLLLFAGPLPHIARFSGSLAPGAAEERPGVPFPSGFLSMSETWWQWDTPSLGAFTIVILIVSLAALLIFRQRLTPVPTDARTADRPAPPLFWLLVALPPVILAMGATVTLFGVEIPLPFRLLHAQTNGMFRMPWRLAPIFVLCVMAFAGQVWTRLLYKQTNSNAAPTKQNLAPPLHLWRGGWGVRFSLSAVFLFLAVTVRLFETAPLEPVLTSYDFYADVGREPGEYTVLEVPVGVGTGEVLLGSPRAIQMQYYGITHGKRMINGFVSRAPLDPLWDIYTLDPMLAWMGQRRLLEPETVETQLRNRIFSYPIGYMVVHTDLIGVNTSTVQEIIGYFNRLDDLLCAPFSEGDAVVYRTRAHPDGCTDRIPPQVESGVYQIDIGGDDVAYVGWGWHWRESIFDVNLRWAGETPQTDIYLDLPPGTYALTIAAQSFWEDRMLRVRVNDQPLEGEVTITPDAFGVYTFPIPADVVGEGRHITVTLDYDGWIVPVEVGQSADERRLAIMVDWMRFTRLSD